VCVCVCVCVCVYIYSHLFICFLISKANIVEELEGEQRVDEDGKREDVEHDVCLTGGGGT